MKHILLLALIGLTACAGPVVMKNPRTGALTQCSTTNMYGTQNIWANDDCAKAYESEGWKRIESNK